MTLSSSIFQIRRFLFVGLVLLMWLVPLSAQVVTGGSGSSVLNLVSTTKGVLTPRMTQAERESISGPATGLLVYQTDQVSGFYFYGGSGWKRLGAAVAVIQDADADTHVQVEKTPNDNVVRFDIAGNEKMTFKRNSPGEVRLEFPQNNGALYLGDQAGKNITNGYNMAVGDSALFSTTTGNRNLAIGRQALFANVSGKDNLALGLFALHQNTADSNMAVGHYALRYNTTGKHNTGAGYESLRNNTTGSGLVAVGGLSLFSNTTADNNTVLGYRGMELNQDGADNTAAGHEIFSNNITGFQNTVLGVSFTTLKNNVDGYQNTAIGQYAMEDPTSMSQTVAVGYGTLRNLTTGNNNTGIGNYALERMTTGEHNVAIGEEAMKGILGGSRNTIIGDSAQQTEFASSPVTYDASNNTFAGRGAGVMTNADGGNNNVAIGSNTKSDESNNTTIGCGARSLSGGVVDPNMYMTILGRGNFTAPNTSGAILLGDYSNLSRVGIGTSDPHPSAILDVVSTSRGLLLPRLTDAQMRGISFPKDGMWVYNTTRDALYYAKTSPLRWVQANNYFDDELTLGPGTQNKIPVYNENTAIWTWGFTSSIEDTDGDSKMQIERNPDDDKFRIRLNGIDRFLINRNAYGSIYVEPFTSNQCFYLGNNAGLNADLASHNTALGYNNLKSVTLAGGSNTAIGAETLVNNTSGFGNTAIGNSVMTDNTTGSYNTAVGFNALDLNVSGDYNTAVGLNALNELTNGNYNTAIGSYAEVSGASLSYATAIGYRARATQSNSLVLGAIEGVNGGTKTVKVGIGTSNPQTRLHVRRDSTNQFNSIVTVHNSGLDASRIKFRNNTSSNEWALQGDPDGVAADARFRFFYTMNVLILEGSGDAELAGNLTEFSDRRLKKNIKKIPFSLDEMDGLSAFSYRWKYAQRNQNVQLGFIAQNVAQHHPALVSEVDGVKSVDYMGFVPVLIEGIKMMDTAQSQFFKKSAKVKSELDQLKADLENHFYIKPR
ncbi:MAG: tail fiber domain-containing protein [Saprospiraceae bacterium]|nr:tail fiber domain-containing protein [Saprospiraceae bacterium]